MKEPHTEEVKTTLIRTRNRTHTDDREQTFRHQAAHGEQHQLEESARARDRTTNHMWLTEADPEQDKTTELMPHTARNSKLKTPLCQVIIVSGVC